MNINFSYIFHVIEIPIHNKESAREKPVFGMHHFQFTVRITDLPQCEKNNSAPEKRPKREEK